MPRILNFLIVASLLIVLPAGKQPLFGSDPPSPSNEWGNLKGRIFVQGEAPIIRNESIPSELAICVEGGLGIKDDNLRIGPDRGLADVFVMLVPSGGEITPPIHPSYKSMSPSSVTLEFSNCRLQPHALIVQTHQKLILKNCDDVGHHCQIDTFQNAANLLVARQSEYSFRFHKPEPTPGSVTCGIHKWIDALILVKDHPYNVISGVDGKFEIRNLPAGDWKFLFWHSRTGYLNEMSISGFPVNQRGEISVKILANQTVDLGQIQVPTDAFPK